MKKIEAIIDVAKLGSVKAELSRIGVHTMTLLEVREFEQGVERTGVYRGSKFKVDLLPRLKLEVVVAESLMESVMEMIVEAADTNRDGEDKVFVSTVERLAAFRPEPTRRGVQPMVLAGAKGCGQ